MMKVKSKLRRSFGFSFAGKLMIVLGLGIGAVMLVPAFSSHKKAEEKASVVEELVQFAALVREYRDKHGVFPDRFQAVGVSERDRQRWGITYFPEAIQNREGQRESYLKWQAYLRTMDWEKYPIAIIHSMPNPEDVDSWWYGSPGFVSGTPQRFAHLFLSGEIKDIDIKGDEAYNAWHAEMKEWKRIEMGWPDMDKVQDDDGDGGAESGSSEAGEKSR